jgi:NADPH-dependent curcumin reductase CurA
MGVLLISQIHTLTCTHQLKRVLSNFNFNTEFCRFQRVCFYWSILEEKIYAFKHDINTKNIQLSQSDRRKRKERKFNNLYLDIYFRTNMAVEITTIKIPSAMKAAQQSEYGEARNVLTLRDNIPVPQQLSSDQILVRVNAASINPVDWKLLNGNLSLLVHHTFPHTPGCDVAGLVVDVGSAVKRFRIGDKVYGNVGMNGGSYAEYVRGNESMFALKPKNLTMEEAAAIPLACETSYQALFTKAIPPVAAGTKVLICGGGTATGLYAIQLAKAVGAQVATTCSQRNFALLEKLGL